MHEGYRMTELGELPDEWNVKKLCQIFTLSKVSCLPYTNPDNLFIHHSIPAWDENGGPRVQLGKEIESNKFLLKNPCILVSKLNPRKPRVIVITCIKDEIPQCSSTEFMVYLPNSNRTYLKYYGYYMISELFHTRLQQVATGTTNSHVRAHPSETLEWFLPEPPFHEQHRIAEILSTVDETIERTEALIEKYRNIKKGLMADLLTRGIDEEGRIRSEETHRFKDSPLGGIPEEWEVEKLGEYSYIKGRIGWRGLKASEYAEDGPYLVAGNHIKSPKIMWDKCDHLSEFRYEESHEIKLRVNDIVISKDGTIGRLAFIDYLPDKATINSTMMLIRPNGNYFFPKYVYHYFEGEYFQRIIDMKMSGSSVPHIFQRDMFNLFIAHPSIDEQKKTAQILTSIDERIEKEESYRDKLLQIKKGLMQDLLTGKVRVKVPQEAVA